MSPLTFLQSEVKGSKTNLKLVIQHIILFITARAMQASLVMAPLVGEVVGEVVKPPQLTHPPNRALAPPVPVASATVQGCGVGDLATAAAMIAWVTRLVSWARAN